MLYACCGMILLTNPYVVCMLCPDVVEYPYVECMLCHDFVEQQRRVMSFKMLHHEKLGTKNGGT